MIESSPPQGFPLPEMLQHYAQAGKSGIFEVTTPAGEGIICLESGMVVHSALGARVAEEAFFDLLDHKDALYRWNEGAHTASVTMTGNVEDLLLRHILRDRKAARETVPVKHSTTLPHYETRAINPPVDPRAPKKMQLSISSFECPHFVFPLDRSRIQVGREPDNDLCIPDTSVSRRHAMLICAADSLIVRDLGSKNGTYIDGQPITQGVVKLGQVVTFGEANCRLDPR